MGPSICAAPVSRIRQDATASLILLWKVTATGFRQCSLIDGRSVTLLQAPGGLVLLEEMLALGPNHFIGEYAEAPHSVSVCCPDSGPGAAPGQSEFQPPTPSSPPFSARLHLQSKWASKEMCPGRLKAGQAWALDS